MAGFKRVFTQFPGFNILGNIESVNTIDLAPPATPLGAGTGTVAIVGEFEDGELESPTAVFGGTDLEDKFGGFGFTVNGAANSYPVAVRSAGSDDANVWNGNGFIALRNKRFAGLIVSRVDNSGGEVTFNRLACLTGGAAPFDLEPAQTLSVSVDGAAAVTATFNAAVGTITGTGGTFPTTFTGGETLELSIDGGPTQVVTFTAADQSLAQVIDRINAATASSIARDSGGQLALDSVIRGYSGTIEVVGGTARATLGLPTAAVPQLDTYTVTSVTAGTYTLRTTVTVLGASTDFDGSYVATGAETVTQLRDALLSAVQALGVPGVTFAASGAADLTATGDANVLFTSAVQAEPTPGDVTVTTTTPAVLTLAAGSGNVANIDLVTQAEAASILGALAGVSADTDPSGNLRLCATTTPATGTILVDAGSTATGLGFTAGTTVSAASGSASSIPAGTRVRDSANLTDWITLTTTAVAADNGGPYTIKVRPAVDDDTTPTAAAGTLTSVLDSLADGWSVTNAADVSRLSSSQMDVRYLDALAATIDVSGVSYDINEIYSARTSERIMLALKSNALDATASGHRARKAIVSPPLATSRADAKASSGVGVGNTGRDQRVFYAFPGLTTFVPEIAAFGSDRGLGFTDDGVINVRSDGFYASVRSILPPEENAGQQLSDTNYGPLNAVGLEDAYNKEQGGVGLTIEDYISFKAEGIIAPRNDRAAGLVFQSDVTAVDPEVQPSLTDAKRRFFGDFIIDSLSDIAAGYVKKLNTPARRRALLSTINAFLEVLRSPNSPETSRLENFGVRDETSPELRAQGFQVIAVAVRQYASMDFIVYRTTVGTTVNVEEITG